MGASTQTVPAWAGWVTLTGGSEDEVPKLSRVDYMSPIINPITENRPYYSTTYSEGVSASINQRLATNIYIYIYIYIYICFDLAVAKKGYALVWQQHMSGL